MLSALAIVVLDLIKEKHYYDVEQMEELDEAEGYALYKQHVAEVRHLFNLWLLCLTDLCSVLAVSKTNVRSTRRRRIGMWLRSATRW